jgi:hypothetical protein
MRFRVHPARLYESPSTPREDNPPKFCTEDGAILIERIRTWTSGYDMYTGEKLPEGKTIILECSLNSEHDYWELGHTMAGNFWWK